MDNTTKMINFITEYKALCAKYEVNDFKLKEFEEKLPVMFLMDVTRETVVKIKYDIIRGCDHICGYYNEDALKELSKYVNIKEAAEGRTTITW